MTCPKCGWNTLVTPDGRHLDPMKQRIGRYLPDGTEITPNELRQGVRAHPLHYCPTNLAPRYTRPAPSTQDSLF